MINLQEYNKKVGLVTSSRSELIDNIVMAVFRNNDKEMESTVNIKNCLNTGELRSEIIKSGNHEKYVDVYTITAYILGVYDKLIEKPTERVKLGSKDIYECIQMQESLNISSVDELHNIVNLEGKDVGIESYSQENIENDYQVFDKLLLGTKEQESGTQGSYEKVVKQYHTIFQTTVSSVMSLFNDLFESGYELFQPYGIIVDGDVATIQDGKLVMTRPYMLSELYDSMVENGYSCNCMKERAFDVNALKEGLSSTVAFPFKLLEYAYGTQNEKDTGSYEAYTKHSKGNVWNGYKESAIKPAIEGMIEATIIAEAKSLGIDDSSFTPLIDRELDKQMRNNCKKLIPMFKSMANCILVSKYVEDDTGNPAEIVLRIVDTHKSLNGSGNFMRNIISGVQIEENTTSDKDNVRVTTKNCGEFMEVSYVFNQKVANGSPLFAFKALDALKAKGVVPDKDNIILGLGEDGKVLVAGGGKQINLSKELYHRIVAGSRSGKGVMTLNLLAASLSSGRPIFYVDRKPDMAGLLKHISNGRMFTVNGAQYSSSDDSYKAYVEEKMTGWDKNIPDYIFTGMNVTHSISGNDICDIFYFRATLFLLGLIVARTNDKLINSLGGLNGIVIIFDENKNFLNGPVARGLTPSGWGSSYIVPDKFDKKMRNEFRKIDEVKKDSDEVKASKKKDLLPTPWEMWKSAFVDKYIQSLNQLSEIKDAGLNSEKQRSDIFIIGQDFDVPSAVPTKSSFQIETNKERGDLKSVDTAKRIASFYWGMRGDGFLGYNGDKQTYAGCHLQTRASQILTESARYFAYTDNFSLDTLAELDGKAIDNKLTFFKPFLILNSAEEVTPDQTEEQISSTHVNQCRGQVIKSLGLDGWKTVVMNNQSKTNPGHLDRRVGLLEYLEEFMSQNQIQQVMGKSGEIAQAVVTSLGYQGTWQEFIFDLRPEWMFSINDIAQSLGTGTKFQQTVENRIPSIVKYRPEMIEGGSEADFGSGFTSDEFESEDMESSDEENNEYYDDIDTSDYEQSDLDDENEDEDDGYSDEDDEDTPTSEEYEGVSSEDIVDSFSDVMSSLNNSTPQMTMKQMHDKYKQELVEALMSRFSVVESILIQKGYTREMFQSIVEETAEKHANSKYPV